MAFARIITRSHQYAQQLALDLLARGYAVEIVSPDAIPSHPADLELRVEAGTSDSQGQITEIREGKCAKSIEYLQRLKPMVADLLRKWPSAEKPAAEESAEGGSPAKSAGFSFNAEPEDSDVELPSAELRRPVESQPTAQDAEFESARLISPPTARKSEDVFSITGEPLTWAESDAERGGGSEAWFWRAAVGFAAVALVILVLGMALRRNTPTAAQQASAVTARNVMTQTQPSQANAAAMPRPAGLSTAPSKPAVTAAAVALATPNLPKAKPSAAVRRTKGAHLEEVDNGDTTVTYFKAKASEPKTITAKQDSGIKHYSDLN